MQAVNSYCIAVPNKYASMILPPSIMKHTFWCIMSQIHIKWVNPEIIEIHKSLNKVLEIGQQSDLL